MRGLMSGVGKQAGRKKKKSKKTTSRFGVFGIEVSFDPCGRELINDGGVKESEPLRK